MHSLLANLTRRIWLPALALPFVATAVIWWLSTNGLRIDNPTNESAALVILWSALAIAGLRALASREAYFFWLSALVANFLIREIDVAKWTSLSVYVGFALLLVLAWRRYRSYERFLGDRLHVTVLACTVLTYFLAMTLDADWWWMLPTVRPAEETVEVVGHLLLTTATLLPSPPPIAGSGEAVGKAV